MVSQKDSKATMRVARFLKPCAKNLNQALLHIPPSPKNHPSTLVLKGWKNPQKNWEDWVDRLSAKYCSIWNKTGICDAILATLYEVPRNQDLIIGLSEFWSVKTNTFVFPWGEATVTLEDIMILGGFPVLGEPVNSLLTEELVKIERKMNNVRVEMVRSTVKKASHGQWLKHFTEKETDFEHVAFLSLWLSRFVFLSHSDSIGPHVFAIAAKLSKGIQVAIAPAVLANLYRNLRFLKQQTKASLNSITVLGPFQLLQIWAFERFPILGPKFSNVLKPGEPRVARWQKLNAQINFPFVQSALRLAENFQWRPYAGKLKNRVFPLHYKEMEEFVFDCSCSAEELGYFARFLQACELLGIDCKEKYCPHRVAMQFGMDQDVPADISDFSVKVKNVKFVVPPRMFQPSVSERYSNWWRRSMDPCKGETKDVSKFSQASIKSSSNESHVSVTSMTLKSLKKLSEFSATRVKIDEDTSDVGDILTEIRKISSASKRKVGLLRAGNQDVISSSLSVTGKGSREAKLVDITNGSSAYEASQVDVEVSKKGKKSMRVAGHERKGLKNGVYVSNPINLDDYVYID